jgi:hypothetical protein
MKSLLTRTWSTITHLQRRGCKSLYTSAHLANLAYAVLVLAAQSSVTEQPFGTANRLPELSATVTVILGNLEASWEDTLRLSATVDERVGCQKSSIAECMSGTRLASAPCANLASEMTGRWFGTTYNSAPRPCALNNASGGGFFAV